MSVNALAQMMNAPERFGNHPVANVKQNEYPGWVCGSRSYRSFFSTNSVTSSRSSFKESRRSCDRSRWLR